MSLNNVLKMETSKLILSRLCEHRIMIVYVNKYEQNVKKKKYNIEMIHSPSDVSHFKTSS